MKEIDVNEKVKQIVTEKLGVEESEVMGTANLMEDLGADSLDTVELIMEFEKQFDIKISDDMSEHIKTINDIVNVINDCLESKQKE